jgi:hypothetical protein
MTTPRAIDKAEIEPETFLETLIRLHRTSEGVGFTGIQPTGTEIDPIVLAAGRALETGCANRSIRVSGRNRSCRRRASARRSGALALAPPPDPAERSVHWPSRPHSGDISSEKSRRHGTPKIAPCLSCRTRVLQSRLCGQYRLDGRLAECHPVGSAGDLPAPKAIGSDEARQQPRLGRDRHAARLFQTLEAKQAQAAIAGSIGEIQLRHITPARWPVLVTVKVAVIVWPPVSARSR